MAKKSGGMFTLLAGVALGAAAVFLSSPKNRKKAGKAANEAKKTVKQKSKKARTKAKKATKVAKKEGRKIKKKVVKAQESRQSNY